MRARILLVGLALLATSGAVASLHHFLVPLLTGAAPARGLEGTDIPTAAGLLFASAAGTSAAAILVALALAHAGLGAAAKQRAGATLLALVILAAYAAYLMQPPDGTLRESRIALLASLQAAALLGAAAAGIFAAANACRRASFVETAAVPLGRATPALAVAGAVLLATSVLQAGLLAGIIIL